MNTTTLAQLITRIRERADMVGSSFVSDREITHMLNQSVAELHNLLVTLYEHYYVSKTTFSLPGGNPTQLPDDFFKVLGVDFDTAGSSYTLKPFMFSERQAYANPTYANTARPDLFYQVRGNEIKFIPETTVGGTVTLWYIPEPSYFRDFSEGTASQSGTDVTGYGTNWTTDFVGATITWSTGETATITDVAGSGEATASAPQTVAAGTFTVSGVETALNSVDREIARGYEEYMILDGAIKCLMKEESDVQMLVALRENVKDSIVNTASRRNPGDPYRIADVTTGTLQTNYINWIK